MKVSIEEKAKRYDIALKKIKMLLGTGSSCSREELEYVFPELKESEDKRMIQYFKDLAPFDKAEELYEKYGFSHKDAIAWLEKKCEQKSVKVPKFNVGDFIQFKGMGHTRYTVKEVCGLSHYINTCNKRMEMSYTDANFELVEQKPAEWSEDDQSNFNELSSFILETYRTEDASRLLIWFKSLKERIQPDKGWIPIKESFYTNNVVLAQKKDKSDVWEGYTVIADHTLDPLVFERYMNIENISTLSLWKPSDEQMKCLDNVKGSDDHNGYVLNTLYNDLKKL